MNEILSLTLLEKYPAFNEDYYRFVVFDLLIKAIAANEKSENHK